MENLNEIMNDFKTLLDKGRIQKAYRYIFEIFTDLRNELQSRKDKYYIVNSMYHGYLDMTYLPVVTTILKENGLKIAVVFNYYQFQFEVWLSAINRKKRKEVLEIITNSKWKKFKTIENDENTDAIIELKIKRISDFIDKSKIVSIIMDETIMFINEIERFIQNNESFKNKD